MVIGGFFLATTAPIILPIKTPGLNQLQKLEMKMRALEKTVEGLQGDLGKANEKIAKLNDEAVKASKGVAKLSKQFRSFAASLIAAGTAQAAFNTGLDRIQSNARLVALARGYEEIEQAQAAATRTAEAFNLSQTEANKQFAAIYGRLRPLGLTVEQIEDAYAGLSTAVKTASLDAAGASALFTQVSQALGSGVVQAEELNTVIDQAPSIVVALAKELGVTAGEVKKLASTGQVSSEQLFKALLRVKEEGVDVLSESLNTPAEKIKAFYNTTEDVVAALTTAVIPELVDGIDDIAAALKALIPLAQVVGRTLSAAFKLAAIPAKGFGDLLANISQGNWEAVLKFDPSGFQQLGDIFGDLFAPLPEVKTGGGRRGEGSPNFPTIPNRGGNGSESGGGGGGSSAADEAAKLAEEMAKQQLAADKLVTSAERRLAVLKATNDIEKATIESESKIFEIAEKYGELTAASLSDTERETLLKAQGLEVQAERLALEEQIQGIQESATASIDEEIKRLQAVLAGKEEEYKWEKMIADAKAAGGVDVEARVAQLKALTAEAEAVENLKSQYDALASGIAGELTNAFRSIIDGSKSAEEAFADMLKSMGDALLDYATEAIAQYIAIGLAKMFAGMLPAGGGGGTAPTGFNGSAQGLLSTGRSFSGGGYTGDGARSGGLDGEGGFMAMLHPQETVVDHSKMDNYGPSGGGGAGGGAPVNINYTGPRLNFNQQEYLPVSAVPGLIKEAAAAGEKQTLGKMRNSPATRRRVGI